MEKLPACGTSLSAFLVCNCDCKWILQRSGNYQTDLDRLCTNSINEVFKQLLTSSSWSNPKRQVATDASFNSSHHFIKPKPIKTPAAWCFLTTGLTHYGMLHEKQSHVVFHWKPLHNVWSNYRRHITWWNHTQADSIDDYSCASWVNKKFNLTGTGKMIHGLNIINQCGGCLHLRDFIFILLETCQWNLTCVFFFLLSCVPWSYDSHICILSFY